MGRYVRIEAVNRRLASAYNPLNGGREVEYLASALIELTSLTHSILVRLRNFPAGEGK